jgi:hypothetical protein
MNIGQQIFVIHGRDKHARREFLTLLRAIGITSIEWTKVLADADDGAPQLSEVLDKVLRPERAFIVLLTDVAGQFKTGLENSVESREKLARRLEAIGCDVDLPLVPSRQPTETTSPASAATGPEFTSSRGVWKVMFENFSIVPSGSTGYLVAGEIINNDESALMLRLKATFYDGNRRPVGSASGIVNYLGDTERQAFKLTSFDNVGDIDRVHVYVDDSIEVQAHYSRPSAARSAATRSASEEPSSR